MLYIGQKLVNRQTGLLAVHLGFIDTRIVAKTVTLDGDFIVTLLQHEYYDICKLPSGDIDIGNTVIYDCSFFDMIHPDIWKHIDSRCNRFRTPLESIDIDHNKDFSDIERILTTRDIIHLDEIV